MSNNRQCHSAYTTQYPATHFKNKRSNPVCQDWTSLVCKCQSKLWCWPTESDNDAEPTMPMILSQTNDADDCEYLRSSRGSQSAVRPPKEHFSMRPLQQHRRCRFLDRAAVYFSPSKRTKSAFHSPCARACRRLMSSRATARRISVSHAIEPSGVTGVCCLSITGL